MMNLNEAEACSTFDIKIFDWNSCDCLYIILLSGVPGLARDDQWQNQIDFFFI